VAGLFREKSNAGWWLISQANRANSGWVNMRSGSLVRSKEQRMILCTVLRPSGTTL
jgi:hypothetical protein